MATREDLGPAERIIQAILPYSDHAIHNRPGVVSADPSSNIGMKWVPVSYKEEGEPKQKVVYRLDKVGKKSNRVRIGILGDDKKVREHGQIIGEYRPSGIFPEVAAWMYRNIAEVWKLDNEFAAKWASYSYGQEHRDLKVIMAAFMLVQSRKGDPVVDAGKIAFYDEDYRDIGEAMMLLSPKKGKYFDPKLLFRIREFLLVPQIAQLNRELGFGKSARHPFLGRWEKAVEKWLLHREENPKLLEGLVKQGFRSKIIDLARIVGYKPLSPRFFEILRWKQVQSKDGRRSIALNQEWAKDSWDQLDEKQICERIVQTKPSWKVIVGRVPKEIGVTRAIMAAAVESNCLSNKDLIIVTETLESHGLLQVPSVNAKWTNAMKAPEDMRAANIALRVKSKEVREQLQDAADTALKNAVEKVVKNVRIYFMVDISGSMTDAIEQAKIYIARFLQGFPLDQLHVSIFNSAAREIIIKHPSAAGVENAFRGVAAGGGTDYGAGVLILRGHPPKVDEDSIFIFVGDEEAYRFTQAVQISGLRPAAFGFLQVRKQTQFDAVTGTAKDLGIPCFMIDEKTFADPYAIPRTIANLIASTPVGMANQASVARTTIIDEILKVNLLQKPAWAA